MADVKKRRQISDDEETPLGIRLLRALAARGISNKVFVAALIPLLVMAGTSLIGLSNVTKLFQQTIEVRKERDKEQSWIADNVANVNLAMTRLVASTRIYLKAHQESLLLQNPGLINETDKARATLRDRVNELESGVAALDDAIKGLSIFAPAHRQESEAKLTNRRHLNIVKRKTFNLQNLFVLLEGANSRTVALLKSGNINAASANFVYDERFILNTFDEAVSRIGGSLDVLSRLIRQENKRASERVNRDAEWAMESIRRETFLYLAVAVLTLGALAYLLATSISKPLLQLSHATKRFADEQKTDLPGHDRLDEIGILARSLEDMLHRLGQSKTLMRSIIDLAPPMIFIQDRGGRFLMVNQSMAAMYGEPPAKLVGKRQYDLHPVQKEATRFAERNRATIIHGGVDESLDEVFTDITGRVHTLHAFRMPFDYDGTSAILGVAVNISDRIEAQLEAQTATAASEAKSKFLANMSHELRTPLNAIIGYAEILDEEAEEDGLDNYRDDIQRILSAGRHLLSLINDVLDFSKIESGKLDLCIEPFTLQDILSAVSSTASLLMQKNDNTFEIECDCQDVPLRSDTTRIRQILLNLLSNAAKFTDKGTVTLRCHIEPDRQNGGEQLVLQVSDTGIGMTPEQLTKLFEEFSQADASITKRFQGTGLGLAICKRLAQLLGGDIEVQSEEAVGTSFTVRLPTKLGTSGPEEDQVARPSAQTTKTDGGQGQTVILVIEDDANARELLARYITSAGMQVVTAASAHAGLERARQMKPDAITLDIFLGGVDGWEVLREVKADPELRHIPVIICSVSDDRQKAMSIGAVEVLTKPISKDAYLAAIRRHSASERQGPIMIVDDLADNRAIMERNLAELGFKTVSAVNGLDALQKLKDLPELHSIMLDLMMPEMNGFDFLTRLRQHLKWRDVPVFVITAIDLTPEQSATLMEAAGFMDPHMIKAIRQHHERPDGSGYPNHLPSKDISDLALVVSMCEVYTARIDNRAHRKPVLAREALAHFQNDEDPRIKGLLLNFAKSIGIYPPGTWVKLANGETAIVVKRQKNSPIPLVRALFDANRIPYMGPVRRDTTNSDYKVIGATSPPARPSVELSALFD